MRLKMIVIWINSHAEYTTIGTIDERYTSMWCACPFLEGQVQRLFMALPVILGLERVGTESALVDACAFSFLLIESVCR